MADPMPPAPAWREIFSGRLGRLTLGLFLLEVLTAVQVLVVTTVLPAITRDLGGLSLYGWAFSASGLATVMAIPLAGQVVDRMGPRRPLAVMLGVFGAGTLLAGLAPTMIVLIAGRFLQGAGAGAQFAVGLGTVAKAYPVGHRPRVLALLAAAWVLPGLFGPSYGALLASTVGWRWAFLTILPLMGGAAWLLFPGLAIVPPPEAPGGRLELRRPIQLSAGAAAVLAGLTDLSWWSIPLILGGLALAIPALVRLVELGSSLAAPGLSDTLADGFLLLLAFFAVDGFVPLMLTRIRGTSVAEASVVVTLATVSWSLGSWWQSRVAASMARATLIRMGAGAIVIGAIGVAGGLVDRVPLAIPYVAWGFAGLGMGVAYPTVYLVAMARSGKGLEGNAVALMLLIDSLGLSTGTGLGGSAIAIAGSTHSGLRVGLSATFAMALVAAGALFGVANRFDDRPS